MSSSRGRPTTDASCYPESGALQPAAGHKGYGLALLIEALSGVFSGALVTRQVGSWMGDDGKQSNSHGAAFLAIDVSAIAPAEGMVFPRTSLKASARRRCEVLDGPIRVQPRQHDRAAELRFQYGGRTSRRRSSPRTSCPS